VLQIDSHDANEALHDERVYLMSRAAAESLLRSRMRTGVG